MAAPYGDKDRAKRVRPRIWRAVVLSLVLAPLHTYWLINLEVARCTGFSTTVSIFFNVILTIVALAAINCVLRRLWPRAALTRAELITVYIMLSLVTALASIDMLDALICLMPYAHWHATPENRWEEVFFDYLPRHWLVSDPAAVQAFYAGGTTIYRMDYIRAWAGPVVLWAVFVVALTTVMLCLNVLIRRRWMDQERLNYPIALMPYDLTDPSGGIFRSRGLWAGFAVAALYDTINGFHSIWPIIPTVNLQNFRVDVHLRSAPWDAIGYTPLALFPFIVGLGYLLPQELLVSFWVFFLVWKAEKIAARAFGLPVGFHQWPFLDEQAFGCYAAIALYALWAMREHLKQAWQAAVEGRPRAPDDPFSYRTAVIGATAGVLVLIAIVVHGGLPVGVALAFFAIYYLIALCVTRMRAQFGPPTHDMHFSGPDHTLTSLLGTRAFQPRALTALTYLYAFNRAYRSHPMPHQLETIKMCQRAGIDSQGLALAMIGAVAWGAVVYFWTYLHMAYSLGAEHKMLSWCTWGYGAEAFGRLQSWLTAPAGPRIPVIGAVIWGFISTVGLMGLQARYVWLPLHPLGYALSTGHSAQWTYSSLFVAWAIKSTITRFWGHKAYQRAVPFFLGLVLGEFIVGGIWTIVGIFTGRATFSFWRG
ncbi:MAG: hypothetical protein N2512_07040 [Armatimonadetes bacterium]|nr:hypothetical protein [Armatimonadota bacterium]